jgi:hypothetical protein
MWHGCNATAWWNMVAKARGRIHPKYWGIGAVASAVSCTHSLLALVQNAFLDPLPAKPSIDPAPVFIIGHWRTGTTFLHELLVEDPRHTYPTTYRCMDPNHFLMTENLFKPYLDWMLPEKRPMDGMETGWEKPQEDEFALLMLGAPSPYRTIAFPNEASWDPAELEIDSLPARLQRRWTITFLRFLRQCQVAKPGRMILKSPTHTWRIPVLLKLFPGARFIHMIRDPYDLYPSTVHLWRSLARAHGLQKANQSVLEERVFEVFKHLHSRLEATAPLVPQGQWAECRFEELMAHPLNTIEGLYTKLDLGGFGEISRRLSTVLSQRSGYKRNQFQALQPQLVDEISQRWGAVIEKQGYSRTGVTQM